MNGEIMDVATSFKYLGSCVSKYAGPRQYVDMSAFGTKDLGWNEDDVQCQECDFGCEE